jgi:hypothetical protein
VQISASPDGGTDSAASTAANFQDSPANGASSQARATLADAPASALVDSDNDGGAPLDNFSQDDTGAAPSADGEDSPTTADTGQDSNTADEHGTDDDQSVSNDVETVPPVCPEGSVPIAAGCAIVDCVYGYIYNGTECEPLCADNTAWDGSKCQPISIHCIAGMTWNGSECVSLCEGDEVWTGSECVTPACPADTSWNGVGCVALETECPAGTWPIGDGCAFVDCSAGQIFNGTECESICPSIATWNGSECVIAEAVCPVGTVHATEGCEVVDCVRGLIFNGTDCLPAGFDCEDDAAPTLWGCSPTDCGVPGHVLSSGECRATCPGGVVVAGDCLSVVCEGGAMWTGTRCIAPGPACPNGQVVLNGVCTQLGFENLPGLELELRPELFNPDLEILQVIPALPQFPGN